MEQVREQVIVRRVRAEDAARVKAVRLEMLVDSPLAYLERVDEAAERPYAEFKARIASTATDHDSAQFIAEADRRLIGQAGAFAPPGSDGVTMIYAVYVTPAWRGIGRTRPHRRRHRRVVPGRRPAHPRTRSGRRQRSGGPRVPAPGFHRHRPPRPAPNHPGPHRVGDVPPRLNNRSGFRLSRLSPVLASTEGRLRLHWPAGCVGGTGRCGSGWRRRRRRSGRRWRPGWHRWRGSRRTRPTG